MTTEQKVEKKIAKTDTKKTSKIASPKTASSAKVAAVAGPKVAVKKVGSKVDMIRVRQVVSSIRRDKRQKLYLSSLGLGKIGAEKELINSNSVKVLIEKVKHLITVVS